MKETKKLKIWLMTAAILIFAMGCLVIQPGQFAAMAEGEDEGEIIQPKLIWAGNVTAYNVEAGQTVNIAVPIRANTFLSYPNITLNTGKNPFSLVSDIKLSSQSNPEPAFIGNSEASYISFTLKIDDSAAAGIYEQDLAISFSYNNDDAAVIHLPSPIIINVDKTKSKPDLSVSNVQVPPQIKAGNKFSVKFQINNKGELEAKNPSISVDGYTVDGIMPDYASSNQIKENIEGGGKAEVTLPMSVAKDAATGFKTVTVKLSFKDNTGTASTVEVPVYINVLGEKKKESDKVEPNVMIGNVSQSVSAPLAGERFVMSFELQNKSKIRIQDIQITPTNLTNNNFSPTQSKPYYYIKALDAGKNKKINLSLIVSKNVTEGLNEIALSYTFKDEEGKLHGPVSAKLYVLNVKNIKKENKITTPKLIISNYSTGEQHLKAGSTFDFRFDVQNTNDSVSAKNIKVTLSSSDKENVFSVTDGSNSFYIPVIKAGETKQNTVNLKIKADSVTKSYPIEVKFEYEYDGMPKPTDGTVSAGVTVSEIINLQVMENARPVVSNISLGYGEPPIVNTPTTINFEFYNMGKSVLSNVTAKVKSKHFSTSSNMLFIGNVEAGNGDSQEMEITPIAEGEGKGELIISYEDSNGETIEVAAPFDAVVQPMPTFEDPSIDPGMDPNIANPQPEKEYKVKPWIFAVIQAGLFVTAIFLSNKITINRYKKRQLQKEQEEE